MKQCELIEQLYRRAFPANVYMGEIEALEALSTMAIIDRKKASHLIWDTQCEIMRGDTEALERAIFSTDDLLEMIMST